ncbi:hypothetical protein HAQ00_00755 [Acidithiobacillus caldus ATCC 51756]|jgi:hypothetical protein|uniref:hypothetical protein n=1 Tax=Acidithiobacillus caldus TaxID=33059 RepID=UPI001C071030|nr:hypothetical protein [Acidithiobacillus caldus]MBU2734282.1 hypothetical protein [Acidithiobacillus caldus ATCC 51756]MBU2801736.1 hypothetical protein [Acidithiobacillus caldus]
MDDRSFFDRTVVEVATAMIAAEPDRAEDPRRLAATAAKIARHLVQERRDFIAE